MFNKIKNTLVTYGTNDIKDILDVIQPFLVDILTLVTDNHAISTLKFHSVLLKKPN